LTLLSDRLKQKMLEVYAQNFDDTWFAVAYVEQEIVTTSFSKTQQSALSNVLINIPFNVPFQVLHHPSDFAKSVLAVLKTIYDGKEVNTSLRIITCDLPPYSRKVLKVTSSIPVGYVSSYGAIAKAIGGSPRAVGNVMAANPFVPIVPCHRVVKSDFTLGGYGGGLKVKIEFLKREKRGFTSLKNIKANDVHLEVFPVEFVFKNLS
jgi:methylated-DNA-[protein]-cysteine S-methyltransferase